MPMYEYACADCGHKFETLVRSGSVPQCPRCHSQALEKLLSVFATPAEAHMPPASMPPACASCSHPEGPGACHLH